MDLNDLVSAERVLVCADIASKKRLLERLASLIAGDGGPEERDVFDSLIGRERLGSTGLGHGVALPHGRLATASAALGAFIKLDRPVDFDAPDRQPVDLVFALVVPEHYTDEHLKIIAHLAEMFRDAEVCQGLRQAENGAQLHQRLIGWAAG